MNNEQFNQVVENRIDQIRKVLVNKAAEYASDTDRLHNFKVAARIDVVPVTPEQALLGMWRKHLVSILDMIASKTTPSAALRDEKIGDSINYLILLEALWTPECPAAVKVIEGTCGSLKYK